MSQGGEGGIRSLVHPKGSGSVLVLDGIVVLSVSRLYYPFAFDSSRSYGCYTARPNVFRAISLWYSDIYQFTPASTLDVRSRDGNWSSVLSRYARNAFAGTLTRRGNVPTNRSRKWIARTTTTTRTTGGRDASMVFYRSRKLSARDASLA